MQAALWCCIDCNCKITDAPRSSVIFVKDKRERPRKTPFWNFAYGSLTMQRSTLCISDSDLVREIIQWLQDRQRRYNPVCDTRLL
jgi:hypothetical protein